MCTTVVGIPVCTKVVGIPVYIGWGIAQYVSLLHPGIYTTWYICLPTTPWVHPPYHSMLVYAAALSGNEARRPWALFGRNPWV